MEIPTGFAQVNLRWTGVGAPTGSEVTFGVDVTAGPSEPADLAQFVAAEFLDANIDSLISSSLLLSSILVKYGPNATGPSALEAATIIGTGGADCEGPNTSYLIHKNTAFGGRAGRGRLYLPGPPTANVGGGGLLAPGVQTNLQTAMDNFHAGMSTGNAPLVLLHGVNSPIQTPTPITSFSVDSKSATQRRRLRR